MDYVTFFKTHDQPEEETFSSQRAIMNLQSKFHELQMERDVLSDLRWTNRSFILHKTFYKQLLPKYFCTFRLKDSRKHVYQMEKMLSVLEELQNIKRFPDQKLHGSEEEVFELDRKVESLEKSIKEVYQTLFEKQCGNTTISNNAGISQAQVLHVNKDLTKNTSKLQKRGFSVSSYILLKIVFMFNTI